MKDFDKLNKYCRKLQRRVYVLEQAVQALLEKDDGYLENIKPFNDQIGRIQIFKSVLAHLDIDVIAETGTKWGATTAFMARQFDGPIFSSELVRESYLIAAERLKHYSNVEVQQLDSREFIRKLLNSDTGKSLYPLFYLDAHWYDDLPLLDEVNLIAGHFENAVILVDDFQVPDDSGYGYDDYGNNNILYLPYLETAIAHHNLDVFFPALSSVEESGAKRGCCLLTKHNSSASSVLTGLETLRLHEF